MDTNTLTDTVTQAGNAMAKVATDNADKTVKVIDAAKDATPDLAIQVGNIVTAVHGALSDAVQFGKDHADQAVNLVLWMARIDAFSSLVPGILAFIGIFLVLKVAKNLSTSLEACESIREEHDYRMDKRDARVMIFWGRALGCGVCCIVMFVFLFNLWAWVGMVYPEVWLAHKVFLRV